MRAKSGELTELPASDGVVAIRGARIAIRSHDQAQKLYDRIVFPLEGNLYGRSLSAAAPPHRFLAGSKGGLYAWTQVRQYPEVILVEGLFDWAVLWEAGFYNVTC